MDDNQTAAYVRRHISDWDAVVSWLRPPPAAEMLLGGSQALGMASDNSDFDFLLLLDHEEDIEVLGTPPGWSVVEQEIPVCRRLLLHREPDEVDIWLLRREGLRPLHDKMQEFIDVLDGDRAGLPGFELIELKVLSRLRAAKPLGRSIRTEAWRSWLQLDLLPTYCATSGLIDGYSYLEDAAGFVRRSGEADWVPTAAKIAARYAAEAIVQAALATTGWVDWDLRYAPAAALSQSADVRPAVLSHLERALFPSADVQPIDETAQLIAWAAEVTEALTDLPRGSAALSYLREFAESRFDLHLGGVPR